MPEGTDLVGVRELSRRFGPPTSWWYAAAERGEVPSYKVGKYRLFRLREVEEYIEAQRQGGK